MRYSIGAVYRNQIQISIKYKQQSIQKYKQQRIPFTYHNLQSNPINIKHYKQIREHIRKISKSYNKMHSNQTINRSHSKKHYHEQSMDDFMKNIKKFNLRSQRYISPKSLLYMYGKNNTYNTIDKSKEKQKDKQKSKSRTLSNHKSTHSKSKRSKKQKQNQKSPSKSKSRQEKERQIQKSRQKINKSSYKSVKSKLQKIFSGNKDVQTLRTEMHDIQFQQQQNPAIFIQKCGDKLKKAEKYLQGKNSIGSYLCQQFLIILNTIVQKMIKQLDRQLKQIQYKTSKKIERRFIGKIQKLQKKNKKMNKIIEQLSVKAQNNSRLIYQIRLLSEIDIDYLFGKAVLGTDKCGGIGYSQQNNQSSSAQSVSSNERIIRRLDKQIKNKQKQKQLKSVQNNRFQTNLNQFRLNLRKQDQVQRQQKQSGRIRQAYDWERQAYDARQREKRQKMNMEQELQISRFKQRQRQLQRQKQLQRQRQKFIQKRKKIHKNIAQQFITQPMNQEERIRDEQNNNQYRRNKNMDSFEQLRGQIRRFENYPQHVQLGFDLQGHDPQNMDEQPQVYQEEIHYEMYRQSHKYKRKST